jgi:MinD superfamily P-loop ATPase
VDAADLHLVVRSSVIRSEEFVGGNVARIRSDSCTGCGQCAAACRFDAIAEFGIGRDGTPRGFRVDPLACEGCGVCVDICPAAAIDFVPKVAGRWFLSQARSGPLVQARMAAGAENSGKLVSHLRRIGREVATAESLDLLLCDGSPGIGCPVIASMTGGDLALIVVEPTLSGLHDFARVAQLAQRLEVPGVLVVNKADLNPKVARRLEKTAADYGIEPLGRVPYDARVTQAQIAACSVVEFSVGPAAEAIRGLWSLLEERLDVRATQPRGNEVFQV